jgi:hypothetical protein
MINGHQQGRQSQAWLFQFHDHPADNQMGRGRNIPGAGFRRQATNRPDKRIDNQGGKDVNTKGDDGIGEDIKDMDPLRSNQLSHFHRAS